MKVNQNISAVISNAQLHRTENNLTASIERLSSGYKINKAKDNPAGIAISNKMRAQIKALNQSSQNAADGTSVLQTADGALNETQAMLQRMRELAVQAASDATMTTEDREACQQEIESLQEEIDRIASDTEFNGKRILDGSQDYRIYPSVGTTTNGNQLISTTIRNFQTSDNVTAQNYKIELTQLPTQATSTISASDIKAGMKININGSDVEISEEDNAEEIYDKLMQAGEYAGVQVEAVRDANDVITDYKLTTYEYGSSASVKTSANYTVTQADDEDSVTLPVDEVKEGFARTVDINGATVTIDKTDTQAAITKKLQEAGAESGVKVEEEKTTDPVTGVDTVTGYKLTPATVTSVDFDMGQTEVILPIEDVRAGTVNIEAPATINHDAQISADDTVDEIFAKLQTLASSSNILVSEIKDSSGTVTGYKLTSARNNIHTKVSFDNNSRTTVTIPLENVKTGNAGTVSVNNKNVTIDATDSQNAIYAKLQEAFEAEGLQVTEMTDANGTLTGYQVVGSSQKVTCSVDTDDIATTNEDGKDTDLRLITANDTNAATGLAYGEGFSDTTTYLTDGKKVTIHDLNGFEMIFEVDPEGDYQNLLRDTVDASGAVVALGAVSDPKQQAIVNLEMTDIGNMTLQVGAHENQVVDVRIPAATCEALYIDDLNLVRIGGADKAITALDAALSQVSDIRSRIGAYENRLDYAVTSLDATEENMESAISRLMDTDMAEEMSTYSNQNVLDQAAIAVLSQANDMPQQILQLLN